jgi:CTD small phosphatase-like protein 2
VRPMAQKFLADMSEHFEIFIFTASNSCYADVVLDFLDPQRRYVAHRLYRESCVQSSNGVFIKDLRVIANRELANMVLVDNASYSFAFQMDNGIPIVPFYDSKQDIEFGPLSRYLLQLSREPDLRDLNRRTFKLHEISLVSTIEQAYKLYHN